MDEREREAGRNEALFREVNERLRELNDTFSVFTGVMEIVCECADFQCVEMITIESAEYERIRAESTWFVVIPGHEIASAQTIVARHATHDIVGKRLGPAEEAVARDPRR